MSYNNLLSMAGWYFLPGMATNYLQPVLYTIFIRAGDPKPQPGSARFVHDRRRIQIAIIVLYLLYTIYEADYQLRQAGDFYQDLGVGLRIDERGLQSRFRRLTVQFHPDKVSSTSEKLSMERIYVQLKLARDTLADPAKRFAYDRFGLDTLTFHAASKDTTNTNLAIRDLLTSGVQRTAAYYVASGAVLVLLSVLGYLKDGMFWRYSVMALMFVMELFVLTRPHSPWILTDLINPLLLRTGLREPYLPFQMLALLRKLAVTLFIAMGQLAPLLSDPRKQLQSGDKVPEALLQQIDVLSRQTIEEVMRMTSLELTPFLASSERGQDNDLQSLKETCKEWLMQNTLRNDPEVRMAVQNIMIRRKEEDEAQSPQV
ncbi:hypothetical protein K431DRAFT_346453 [Polychaeton citri CBS 116435]|uniref:J domain-containing protein n=1 Tax=Polychaeton citri CBS 116435 TaxID=1314669 RepID=A0A9P4UML4_9PEZI|nr:hypothetical protein K431DRAFT_346453 [Polychaeton citri CBS 116435]